MAENRCAPRADGRTRTDDLLLTRQLLYQLSYVSKSFSINILWASRLGRQPLLGNIWGTTFAKSPATPENLLNKVTLLGSRCQIPAESASHPCRSRASTASPRLLGAALSQVLSSS